jgi:GNAT superfamily N-acetyltransferase
MSALGDPRAERARAWRNGIHDSACDVIEPCAVGTVVRATRYPSYWQLNVVRVEVESELGVAELAALSDEALAGLEHRQISFDLVATGERLRSEFEAAGWQATRLVWMRHEAAIPPGPSIALEEVPHSAVRALRRAWHAEDFPGRELTDEFIEHSEEVSALRGGRVLAAHEDGVAVGFAQLECYKDGVEVSDLFVLADHRGAGRGTALTRAAIAAAGSPADLWICADDEDRPKELYARLGFRPAWKTMVFLRLPEAG